MAFVCLFVFIFHYGTQIGSRWLTRVWTFGFPGNGRRRRRCRRCRCRWRRLRLRRRRRRRRRRRCRWRRWASTARSVSSTACRRATGCSKSKRCAGNTPAPPPPAPPPSSKSGSLPSFFFLFVFIFLVFLPIPSLMISVASYSRLHRYGRGHPVLE